MSRINVLWVIDHVCYDGNLHGGGRLFWNVVPEFDTHRFNVIPCMLRASDDVRQLFQASPVRPRLLDKRKYDLTTLWTFLKLIKQERIDVLHLHCYGASVFGRMAGAIASVPSIIHDYDTAVYFPYPWYLSLADRLLSRFTSRAVAASPMVRDYFVRRRKVPIDKVSMALHAIPNEKFTLPSIQTIRRKKAQLKVDTECTLVGTVTKLGPQRGNKFFVRTAARVIKKLPGVVFVLGYKPTVFHRRPSTNYVDLSRVEKETDLEDIRSLIRKLDLEEQVRLVEAESDQDDLVSSYDIFIAPFLSGRFSSVNLLEALAMGKVAVATEIGEAKEIIVDGINGCLVPAGDEEAMAERLIELITHPRQMEELSRQASISAQRYSAREYARFLERWYTELATGENGRVRNISTPEWH